MKIDFALKGCRIQIRDGEDILELNWQEVRRLSEIILAVIENIDKHNIVSGTIIK